MTERWKSVILGLAMAAMLGGCLNHCGWLLSAGGVTSCPEQTMSAAEAEALYQQGIATTERDKSGEYYRNSALADGLPILKKAALQGHRGAMDNYCSHLIQAGIIDMTSGPFWWRSQGDVAEEAMMWLILRAHLGKKISDGDKDTFRVLLDPSIAFPEGFFRSGSGTAWMLQMVSPSRLDRARKQAFAWRGCWPK